MEGIEFDYMKNCIAITVSIVTSSLRKSGERWPFFFLSQSNQKVDISWQA